MCNCVYKEVWAENVDLLCMLCNALGWRQGFGRHGGNPAVKVAFESLNGDKPHWIYYVVLGCRLDHPTHVLTAHLVQMFGSYMCP